MITPRPVALVTGAGAGIGRACAVTLGHRGYHVIAVDREGPRAESTTRDVHNTHGFAEAYSCDVRDSSAVNAMVEHIVARHGRLDGAVNNAGISGARVGVADLDDEAWIETRSIDLDAVFYCMRAQIRAMRSLGGGSIVNMGSVLSTVAFPNAAAYIAAKHGLLGLTRSAALDYAAEGIRVNAVGPGFIDVERHQNMDEQARQDLVDRHPRGRLGSPEDVAELVTFLLGEKSLNITGSFLPTDGGYTIH